MNTAAATIATCIARLSAFMIAAMPFHAFMTVWLSSALGHYTLLRLWKEILLLGLFAAAMAVVAKDAQARKAYRQEVLLPLITLYLVWLLIVGGIAVGTGSVSTDAFLYGFVSDSRYLVFFAVVWLATRYCDLIVRLWKKLLLVPAAVTVGFAALQYALLPADFLRHFGYGPDTIAPMQTIDQKDAYQRVQSTLRGANPFGAYLIIVLSALGGLIASAKKLPWKLVVFFAFGGMALVFTFSRSAWLGTLAALAWLLWIAITSSKLRRVVVIAGIAAVVAFAAVGYALRDNDHFQNVFFHTNEHSQSSESSNYGHFTATWQGVQDVVRYPLGLGVGSAGPASVYNDAKTRIAENYYVQIGQEAGVIGLLLFGAVNVLTALRLWQRRNQVLARVLLASFLGIFIVNMLMHGWADDTLAYIWWGLAGAAIALPLSAGKKTGKGSGGRA